MRCNRRARPKVTFKMVLLYLRARSFWRRTLFANFLAVFKRTWFANWTRPFCLNFAFAGFLEAARLFLRIERLFSLLKADAFQLVLAGTINRETARSCGRIELSRFLYLRCFVLTLRAFIRAITRRLSADILDRARLEDTPELVGRDRRFRGFCFNPK